MPKSLLATALSLAIPALCHEMTPGAEAYPADTDYPVRICGRFHVKNDRLYLETRQTLGNVAIDLLLVPRKLPALGPIPPIDPPLEVIGHEEIARVKTLTTQNDPVPIVGCAYSGRFPVLGQQPALLIEKLIAKKAIN